MMRILWLLLGTTSVSLGAIGIFLPLLPTVPFLLLAAFCFARSSERLHHWLLSHPQFGKHIVDWQSRGAISLPAKRLATLSIALVFLVSVLVGLRPMILGIQGVTLCLVMIFIWTRPSA